jgi:hypothetical protein
MEKRVKTERIVLRVTPEDKATVDRMAGQAGVSVTDFVMSKVWGEVPTKPADARSAPNFETAPVLLPVANTTAAKLSASIPGVRVGVQAAIPGEEKAKVPGTRRFNPSRPAWYNLVRVYSWCQILEDLDDAGVWLDFKNGQGRLFPSVLKASEYVDANSSD